MLFRSADEPNGGRWRYGTNPTIPVHIVLDGESASLGRATCSDWAKVAPFGRRIRSSVMGGTVSPSSPNAAIKRYTRTPGMARTGKTLWGSTPHHCITRGGVEGHARALHKTPLGFAPKGRAGSTPAHGIMRVEQVIKRYMAASKKLRRDVNTREKARELLKRIERNHPRKGTR